MHEYLKNFDEKELKCYFNSLGLDKKYFNTFKDMFSNTYNAWIQDEDESDTEYLDKQLTIGKPLREDVAQFVSDHLVLYAKYMEQGNSETWSHYMMDNYSNFEYDEERTLFDAFHHFSNLENSNVDAIEEIKIHCKALGGDAFFIEYYIYEMMNAHFPNIEQVKQFSSICNEKIKEGHDSEYAKDFAFATISILKGDYFLSEDFACSKIDEEIFADTYAWAKCNRKHEPIPKLKGTSLYYVSEADEYSEKFTIVYGKTLKELGNKESAIKHARLYTDLFFKGLEKYHEEHKGQERDINQRLYAEEYAEEYINKQMYIIPKYGLSGDNEDILDFCYRLESVFEADMHYPKAIRRMEFDELEKDIVNYNPKTEKDKKELDGLLIRLNAYKEELKEFEKLD